MYFWIQSKYTPSDGYSPTLREYNQLIGLVIRLYHYVQSVFRRQATLKPLDRSHITLFDIEVSNQSSCLATECYKTIRSGIA